MAAFGNLGFDASAAAGLLGGGLPWGGGAGFAPYVPVTPLGALESYKGDLIYPIVAVGVALFILLIIVLAVKAALTWKLELLDSLTGHRARRDVSSGSTPPPQNQEQMSWLTKTVMSALENENCSQRILCQMGTYAKGTSVPSYMSWLESYMSEDYKDSLTLFKNSAEGRIDCSQFKCGGSGGQTPPPAPASTFNQGTTAQFLDPNNPNTKVPNASQSQQNANEPITNNNIQP